MKRRLMPIVALLLAVAIVIGGLLWWIRPVKPLDLSYTKLSIADKIYQMIRSRQFSIELNEVEVNQLLKKAFSEHRNLSPQMTVTGADFKLEENRLLADVNLLYAGKLEMGIRLFYTLEWESPNVVAVFQSASIKGFTLPEKWLHPTNIQINVNHSLPSIAEVKDVQFTKQHIHIKFKLNLAQGY